MRTRTILMFALAIALTAGTGAAGNPDDPLDGRADGIYRLTYPVREGVYGDGRSRTIIHGGGEIHDTDWCGREMNNGPARLETTIRHGEVVEVDLAVGGDWRAPRRGEIDLGEVAPGRIAARMLDLAATAGERVAEDALLAAMVARCDVAWPRLLAIARDRGRPDDVRERILFWLAEAAGDEAADALGGIAAADDENAGLREAAVFALRQLSEETALPILMEMARRNDRPEVMRAALIGLAQIDAPEVVDLFEDILVTR